MPIQAGNIVYSLTVDDSGLVTGFQKADQKVTEAAQQINTKMVGLAAAFGGAIGSVIGTYVSQVLGQLNKIQAFFTESWKVTADYGLEMEHLGTRMGMTAQQAAVLTGMMERQGLNTGVAARAMQIMAMEMRQTQQALDPFTTKMGQLLGTLRDSSGRTLEMSQVLDLARQKINGAATDTEKLQMAQQLFGTRMGGQLLPLMKLSNEEWAKQSAEIAKSLGPVDQAADAALKYKNAMADLEQNLRGVQLTMGVAMLPTIASWIKEMSGGLTVLKDWVSQSSILAGVLGAVKDQLSLKLISGGAEAGTAGLLKVMETLGIVSKGTTDNFQHMAEYQKQAAQGAADAAKAKEKEAADADLVTGEIQESEKVEGQLVSISGKRVELAEKLAAIGGGTQADIQVAIEQQLLELTKQRVSLEQDLARASTEDQRLEIQEKLLQNQLAGIQAVGKATEDQYKQEEMAMKAAGQLNSSTELQFLQEQLNDSRIVGDERLKIEAELFTKKKAYEEDMMKISRELGVASVQDEINFRQQKTKELLGSGDVSGAAGEMKKIQDLRLQEGDSQLEWEKKYQIISIQYEIDFQKQKLEVVKGNAVEERKVLESIADLDKELYDKRLSYATNYSSSIQGQYDAIMKAAKSSGDVQSFEQAKVAGDRQLLETAQQAAQVTHGGGTTEQREGALKFAAFVDKMEIDQKQSGQEQSDMFKQVLDYVQQIKRSAGLDTRDVTGPGAAVSSITAPSEGLATTSLARGTEIPRLDTSYTDLAVRIRDTFLNAIPNINAFADAVSKAAVKITGGNLPNPINLPPGGGLGPGGGPTVGAPGASLQALPNGPGTPAQPQAGTGTITVGGTTLQLGQGGQPSDAIASLRDTTTANTAALKDLQDNLTDFKVVFGSLVDAMKNQKVSVSVDPNSKEGIVAVALQGGTEALQ